MTERRRDVDPSLADSIDQITGTRRRSMPKPPADALIVFRCPHQDGRAPLIGWVARGAGSLVVVLRVRVGTSSPTWSTSTVGAAALEDLRDHGCAAHCGDHAHWLEGDDWTLPRPGYPGRRVMKDPGQTIT